MSPKAEYLRNREKYLDRAKRRYWKQREQILAGEREAYRVDPLKKLLYTAKERALKTGREFSLTVSDISIPEICPILNVPLVTGTRYAPSIDRIDNSQGYIRDNVWVISRLANKMKNDATIEELRKFGNWASQLTP